MCISERAGWFAGGRYNAYVKLLGTCLFQRIEGHLETCHLRASVNYWVFTKTFSPSTANAALLSLSAVHSYAFAWHDSEQALFSFFEQHRNIIFLSMGFPLIRCSNVLMKGRKVVIALCMVGQRTLGKVEYNCGLVAVLLSKCQLIQPLLIFLSEIVLKFSTWVLT